MYKFRPLHAIDFYKADHISQYPDGTNLVYSNFTPRSSRLANYIKSYFDDKAVVFGHQAFIKAFFIDLWNKEFFELPRDEVVAYYKRRMDTSLGADAVKVKQMLELHDLGYLPVRIKVLPEGSLCPMRVPMLSIVNTIDSHFWLVNYVESVLSACLWKFSTSATTAFQYRRILDRWCDITGGTKDLVPFQGHDFSFRGMSGLEDAVMSGSGHLLSFVGTDSVLAIDFLEDYYNANAEDELIGCSVPATEHSVMCMGEKESEIDTFRRLINEIYPAGIVSIVSDTWDFWKVVTEYMVTLKDEVMARDGKVVLRPDSGDPIRIVAGYNIIRVKGIDTLTTAHIIGDEYDYTGEVAHDTLTGKYHIVDINYWPDGSPDGVIINEEISEAEAKGAVVCLYDIYGGTLTESNFKTLDSHVGLLYGDSITLERAEEILRRLHDKGFSSDNIVFGIGSYTYEYVTRDTLGFAMKATYGEVDNVGREIFKDPVTDSGVKKSAKGLLAVRKPYDDYVIEEGVSWEEEGGCLETVFEDGRLVRDESLSVIRERLASNR